MKLVNFRNIPIIELALRLIPDELYIKILYRKNFGIWPNLKNPKTFTEKIQWLKLNYRIPEYTIMVDKLLVKNYVSKIIGKKYIIPTIASWKTVDDIDLNLLPDKFVLKWNHDSGSVIICKDKKTFDVDEARKKLSLGQRKNGFWYGREWPYKSVKPMLIAEQFMAPEKEIKDVLSIIESKNGVIEYEDLKDYKLFCFNGKVEFFKVDFDRFSNHRANYYTKNGDLLPFGEKYCPPKPDANVVIPQTLPKMIELAEMLTKSMPFARVDFYDVKGNIYFGEITFYPASGFGPFTSSIWDTRIGDLLLLPK